MRGERRCFQAPRPYSCDINFALFFSSHLDHISVYPDCLGSARGSFVIFNACFGCLQHGAIGLSASIVCATLLRFLVLSICDLRPSKKNLPTSPTSTSSARCKCFSMSRCFPCTDKGSICRLLPISPDTEPLIFGELLSYNFS